MMSQKLMSQKLMSQKFDDLLKNRSSIRQYKDKKLSENIVRSLVESAMTAPSPSNSQPVRYFHLVSDRVKDYLGKDFIVDDINLRDARFNLISATKQILHNGLILLGVSAPIKM